METTGVPTLPEGRTRAALVALLVLAFLVRVVALDQPIVENYVGRQVPTAMVARNLERGSGFLSPQLDVAPFPNLFLVEPPIYAWRRRDRAAGRRGLPLDAVGPARLGAGHRARGLGTVRSRIAGAREMRVALGGRRGVRRLPRDAPLRAGVPARRPDARPSLAGLRFWDDFEEPWRVSAGSPRRWSCSRPAWRSRSSPRTCSSRSRWSSCGHGAPGPGNSPWRRRRSFRPLLWYSHAARLDDGRWRLAGLGRQRRGSGSACSFRRPSLRLETYGHIGRFLLVRAFTPLGTAVLRALAAADSVDLSGTGTTGSGWSGGLRRLAAMAVLAAKLHHEYYWLAGRAGRGRGSGQGAPGDRAEHGVRGRVIRVALVGIGLIALSARFRGLDLEDAARVGESGRERHGRSATTCRPRPWVVAPEALLFAADRRGCRLEFTALGGPPRGRGVGGVARGFRPGRAGGVLPRHGARLRRRRACRQPSAAERLALHDAIRRRYNVLWTAPGVLIAELTEPRREPCMAPATPTPR